MGSDARRKERQRLKRKQKRHAIRRAEAVSPYRKFGSQGEIVACYVNEGWQENGLAEVLVLKRVGAGMAYAAFLIDMWCSGLKDAWGRINITRSDFDSLLERTGSRLGIVRIDPTAAWRIVSGGVRFCRQNGFRLPPRCERWTALLGNNAECTSADLSDFGIEGGKLRYVGSMEDLQRRLVGCRPEEFLHRQDVEFILGDQPWDDEDNTSSEGFEECETPEERNGCDEEARSPQDEADVEEAIGQFHQGAVDAVRRWCFANGIEPHPRLSEAVGLTIMGALQAALRSEGPDDDESLDETVKNTTDNIDALLAFEPPQDDQALRDALDQMGMFCKQFSTPTEFMAALGMEVSGPESAGQG